MMVLHVPLRNCTAASEKLLMRLKLITYDTNVQKKMSSAICSKAHTDPNEEHYAFSGIEKELCIMSWYGRAQLLIRTFTVIVNKIKKD